MGWLYWTAQQTDYFTPQSCENPWIWQN